MGCFNTFFFCRALGLGGRKNSQSGAFLRRPPRGFGWLWLESVGGSATADRIFRLDLVDGLAPTAQRGRAPMPGQLIIRYQPQSRSQPKSRCRGLKLLVAVTNNNQSCHLCKKESYDLSKIRTPHTL